MEFAVCSYNVRHQTLDDGPNQWQHRRDAVFELLRTVSPDIIGLQESTGKQQRDIEHNLNYQWHGVADEPGSGKHNPIGVGSRFSCQAEDAEWLSPTPAVQSTGWDAAYPRVLTQLILSDEVTERSLAVYNVHFDHKGPKSRKQSARQIRDRIASLPTETEAIVLGDFNCLPGSTPYEILTADSDERQLQDTRAVASKSKGPTTTVTDFTSLDPDRRLDHVFVTPGLSTEVHWINDFTADDRYPSDHLPVVVQLSFI